MYCRERLLGNAMPVECSLNPRLGREYRYRWQDLQKNGNSRPVVVVGGGPGGLECAVILAKRGFAVTLLEKEAALGGTLNIAKLPAPQGQPPGRHRRAGAGGQGTGRHREAEHRGHAGDRGGPAPRGVFLLPVRQAGGAEVHPGIDKEKLSSEEI